MTTNKIGLLAIGSELLDGRVLDTNTHWLTGELQQKGIEVYARIICTDSINDIKRALGFLIEQKVQAIIICGGIGPTTDDLTREAVAEFLNVTLEYDAKVTEQLKELFLKRGRLFNASNEKQAYRPEGSSLIPNNNGTAPGFLAKFSESVSCYLYSLPGIPAEMKAMFKESVEPHLIGIFKPKPLNQLVFRVFGITESRLNENIKPLNLPAEIQVAYAVSFPVIDLILRSSNASILNQYEGLLINTIGKDYIFSRSLEVGLAQVLLHDLKTKGLTLATAESCTGGLIGDLITEVAGSSEVYLGGIISYSNLIKQSLLGVPEHTLSTVGAVSEETVSAMANGARDRLGSDLAVSVSGVAGPSGGTIDKPVGTVYIGLASKDFVRAEKFSFPYDRQRVRRISAFYALNMVRLLLQE